MIRKSFAYSQYGISARRACAGYSDAVRRLTSDPLFSKAYTQRKDAKDSFQYPLEGYAEEKQRQGEWKASAECGVLSRT